LREIIANGAPARFDRCIDAPVCTDCDRPLKERTRAADDDDEHQCTMCAAESSTGDLWSECLSCGHSLCRKCCGLVKSNTRFDVFDHVRCTKCKAIVRADRAAAHRKNCKLPGTEGNSARKSSGISPDLKANACPVSKPPVVAEDAPTPVISDGSEADHDDVPAASAAAAVPHATDAVEPAVPHQRDDEADEADEADIPSTTWAAAAPAPPRFSGEAPPRPIYSASPFAPLSSQEAPRSQEAPAQQPSTASLSASSATMEEILMRSAERAQASKPRNLGGPSRAYRSQGASRNEALMREALLRGNVVEIRGVPPTATEERLAQFVSAPSAACIAYDRQTGTAWAAMQTRIMAHDAVANCGDILFDEVQLNAQISSRGELPIITTDA
jgi:hypothetical protein